MPSTGPCFVPDFGTTHLGVIARPFRFSNVRHLKPSCGSAITGNPERRNAARLVIGREEEGGATDQNTKRQHC